MATSMPSITEPSGYVLEPIRKGVDFTLYRGRQHGNPSPVLVVALTAEQPSPQAVRRLEHEYSLAAELDPGNICVSYRDGGRRSRVAGAHDIRERRPGLEGSGGLAIRPRCDREGHYQ